MRAPGHPETSLAGSTRSPPTPHPATAHPTLGAAPPSPVAPPIIPLDPPLQSPIGGGAGGDAQRSAADRNLPDTKSSPARRARSSTSFLSMRRRLRLPFRTAGLPLDARNENHRPGGSRTRDCGRSSASYRGKRRRCLRCLDTAPAGATIDAINDREISGLRRRRSPPLPTSFGAARSMSYCTAVIGPTSGQIHSAAAVLDCRGGSSRSAFSTTCVSIKAVSRSGNLSSCAGYGYFAPPCAALPRLIHERVIRTC